MPVTRLSDVYNPKSFFQRAQELQIRKNRFIRSGIAVPNPTLQEKVNGGGDGGEIPFYKPLELPTKTVGTNTGKREPNYSSDDPAVKSTPDKISDSLEKWKLSIRNKSWSVMTFAQQLALKDPAGAILDGISDYWAADDEIRIISGLYGIMQDNIANDSKDMVIDVSLDTTAAVADAERIGGERVLDALQTMGDHASALKTLAVPSIIATRLRKQNLISTMLNSQNQEIETYMDKRLISYDFMPAWMGTNRMQYICMLFGPGVVTYAFGRNPIPFDIKHDPDSGNGGGQDTFYSRVNNLFHMPGFSYLPTAVNGGDYATLELAASWDRTQHRKLIPLAFIKVND